MTQAEDSGSSFLKRITNAKSSRAVLKHEFATHISNIPVSTAIFVSEGPDDKCIYHYWMEKLIPQTAYESFISENKCNALKLYDSLCSDLTGLAERVYFFLDKDFDGPQGRTPSSKLFLTDCYSVENYFVCRQVLESVLTVDFHCNGYPSTRLEILNCFETDYAQFLKVTKQLNFRIFVARQLASVQCVDMPSRISHLADVQLGKVSSPHSGPPTIALQPEPSASQFEQLAAAFEAFDPRAHYRGKFALLFFKEWLAMLRADRASEHCVMFKELPPARFKIHGGFSFETLAPKVPPPPALKAFLARAMGPSKVEASAAPQH
ncbi:DUF4435 domain-containing protein [Aquincola tertiaricarbonis]|uniref:DUF4435 domain-containing protein n=1 Tax=Aquincola tertiaricarbonis TaxID=391953 RepID=UPI0009F8D02B|nr:DUF4435 domain-containing protein [Aquincola tertiaricarbonis]